VGYDTTITLLPGSARTVRGCWQSLVGLTPTAYASVRHDFDCAEAELGALNFLASIEACVEEPFVSRRVF